MIGAKILKRLPRWQTLWRAFGRTWWRSMGKVADNKDGCQRTWSMWRWWCSVLSIAFIIIYWKADRVFTAAAWKMCIQSGSPKPDSEQFPRLVRTVSIIGLSNMNHSESSQDCKEFQQSTQEDDRGSDPNQDVQQYIKNYQSIFFYKS